MANPYVDILQVRIFAAEDSSRRISCVLSTVTDKSQLKSRSYNVSRRALAVPARFCPTMDKDQHLLALRRWSSSFAANLILKLDRLSIPAR
jgi:hypothetical protein